MGTKTPILIIKAPTLGMCTGSLDKRRARVFGVWGFVIRVLSGDGEHAKFCRASFGRIWDSVAGSADETARRRRAPMWAAP